MENDNLDYNPSLDEIVFEHRNKEYGAYDLRTNYRRILTRSMIIGTVLFCLAAITPFVIMKIKQLAAPEQTLVDINLKDINIEEEKPKDEIVEKEELPPPPPKQEEKIEIIQNVVPEPVKAPKVETPPPPISKQLETTTGLINQEGLKQTSHIPPPQAPPKAAAVESKAPSTTEVYNSVDQSAEYPGGMNALRAFLGENFDTSIMDGGEGQLKCKLKFVVERDGSVSNVVITEKSTSKDFDNEAIRVVKKLKKWTPGKLNGESVRSYYSVPFTMNFE